MLNKILSDRIKTTCKKRNVAVKKALSCCELNRNFIYDLEKGGSFPSYDKISRLADYLDCSVDYLLGRTDVPEVNRRTAKKASFADKQPANNIIRLAGRDGSMIELKLTDEEASIMQNAITRCEEVGEDDF